MGCMQICVEFPIACSADSAWNAAHTTAVAAKLYRPMLHMTADGGSFPDGGSLPERFTSGDEVRVSLRFFGIVPLGSQLISIEDVDRPQFPAHARTMRDAGRPLTGPLALLTGWNHEMTVWPTARGTAVWHDELRIRGFFAPVFALALWPMWQWRKAKLRRLANAWV